MDWNQVAKYVAYGVLIGAYGLFAWTGKAPVSDFLTLITGALAALGAVHVTSLGRDNTLSQDEGTQNGESK